MNQNLKGKAFERKVVRLIKHKWLDARRTSEVQRRKDSGLPDIDGTPYFIECKHLTRRFTRGAIDQIVEKVKHDWSIFKTMETWVIIYRQTGEHDLWVVVPSMSCDWSIIPFNKFLEVY